MKRINNLSVYTVAFWVRVFLPKSRPNLLGYLLFGIAAYAFVNANNTNVIATAPVSPEQTQSAPNRHTITLVLKQLSDLKVEEGQRINVGEIISDRTSEKAKLQAKKQRLVDGLTRAKLPFNELKPVPVPQFQTELANLKQAQFNLDAIVSQINNFDQKLYHKDPWHVQVFESEKVQELADLRRREEDGFVSRSTDGWVIVAFISVDSKFTQSKTDADIVASGKQFIKRLVNFGGNAGFDSESTENKYLKVFKVQALGQTLSLISQEELEDPVKFRELLKSIEPRHISYQFKPFCKIFNRDDLYKASGCRVKDEKILDLDEILDESKKPEQGEQFVKEQAVSVIGW